MPPAPLHGASWLHGRLCYPEECGPRRGRGGRDDGSAPSGGPRGAGRGGVGAGERATVAGPGPLCSPPSPPAPAARGSAILASGAPRRGGRDCRPPGPTPPPAAAPGTALGSGVVSVYFTGTFFHPEAFDKMEGELRVSGAMGTWPDTGCPLDAPVLGRAPPGMPRRGFNAAP